MTSKPPHAAELPRWASRSRNHPTIEMQESSFTLNSWVFRERVRVRLISEDELLMRPLCQASPFHWTASSVRRGNSNKLGGFYCTWVCHVGSSGYVNSDVVDMNCDLLTRVQLSTGAPTPFCMGIKCFFLLTRRSNYSRHYRHSKTTNLFGRYQAIESHYRTSLLFSPYSFPSHQVCTAAFLIFQFPDLQTRNT